MLQEWDVDRSGGISKKEFKSAVLGSGIEASTSDIETLFDKWDADRSGAIDYAELNKALKHAGGNLSRQLSENAEREADGVLPLGAGMMAAYI